MSTPAASASQVSWAGPVFFLWIAACAVPAAIALSSFGHGSIFFLEPFLLLAFVGGSVHAFLVYLVPLRLLSSFASAALAAVGALAITVVVWLFLLEPGMLANTEEVKLVLFGLIPLGFLTAAAIWWFYLKPKLASKASTQ